jgi:preprotein translocase subunit SecB
MADEEQGTSGNGADDNGQPQVSILAQYVKDLSVENPSAPQVYSWQVQPQLDVQFNLNVEGAQEGVHEVTLKFDISARSENGTHFVIQVISDAVSSTGFPPLMLDPIDFAAAYMAQLEAVQQQGGASGSGENEPAPSEA